MTLRLYQVDAFHHEVLRGNPAAIIPLAEWLPDEQLQAIAQENNLSETAYFLPEENGAIPLRWFTPVAEVRLCGHATLASAHVLYHEMLLTQPQLTFSTQSGPLHVRRAGDGYQMDFPADFAERAEWPSIVEDALGFTPLDVVQGKDDWLVIAPSETHLRELVPDQQLLAELGRRGVIVSAKGDEVDFVSRCFFPNYGIPEDPVTGSAHTLMTPYWANQLGKTDLSAIQVSARTGLLQCKLRGDRVLLEGNAVTYLRGEIYL